MTFKTVGGFAEAEFTERRSRFIGYVRPVETEAAAVDFVAEIKALHREATHNVSAYRLLGGAERYSDDGEPQGTAGVPVLEVLTKRALCNLCVVVTRYFGGVLLGAGGLVRAYSHAAGLAVDAAGEVVMTRCERLRLSFDYALYGKIQHLLTAYPHKILDSAFGAVVTLELAVAQSQVPQLTAQLSELSAGQLIPEQIGELFLAF